MRCQVASTVRSAALRSRILSLAKTCSIGLRSGEYGGRNSSLAPAARMARRTALPLWEAERLLRNLARRLEQVEPGVAGSILEGLEEILTVIRLGLPRELRRSLACTNIVENALDTVRQVTRNVNRWRNAEMALRWTAAGLLEAQKTFRRLKAYRSAAHPPKRSP